MNNLKIHFWDSVTSHIERTSFRESLKEKGIATSTETTDLGGINIVFIHGGDSHSLNDFVFRADIFKVSFGDNVTDLNPIFKNENRISYINSGELIGRFDKIYEELNAISNLTIERLYEIVFGFDKELEEYLKPFATLSPFATKLPNAKDSNGNEIKKDDKTLNIKEVLTDYIKDKIAKQ